MRIQQTATTWAEAFLSNINTFFNGGLFSPRDMFLSFFWPAFPLIRHSHKILQQHGFLMSSDPVEKGVQKKYLVENYRGHNDHVKRMASDLKILVNRDIYGAYVHGSLGTYEEIFYSDFDALVIIRDDVFENPARLIKVARRINAARSIMYDFDPLQHHGWFVLTSAYLKYWPDYFFPSEILKYAKAIFPGCGVNLNLNIRLSPQKNWNMFMDLSRNLLRGFNRKVYPQNMYQLKGLLSQFMLLPSLYIRVRDDKSVFKKFSFELSKPDFIENDWSIMEEVSQIREDWICDLSALKRFVLTRFWNGSRFLVKKWAPPIPSPLQQTLTDKFYHRMAALITVMLEKAGRIQSEAFPLSRKGTV